MAVALAVAISISALFARMQTGQQSLPSREPSEAEVRYQQARSYLAQGKPLEALPHLEDAYRQGLRHAGVVMALAQARFAAGQDDRAVELLETLATATSAPNLLFEVGKMFFDHILYRQALAPLQKVWQQTPGSYEIGMYLALSHYLLEQYEPSEAVLTGIKTEQAVPVEYFSLLGSVYARLSRWQEAQVYLEKAAVQAPDRADGLLNLGLFHLDRGNRQKAAELLETGSANLRPGTKIFYMARTRANCDGLALPSSSAKRDNVRGEFYTNLGLALQKMQHWVSALEVYRLALEADYQAPAAYGGIGLICQELGTPEVGRAFLRQGIHFHPETAELHYYLGTVHASMGAYEEAMRSYERAIGLAEPKVPPRYLIRLGIAQLAALEEAEAEKSFRRALERDPNFAPTHYELGKLYRKNGDLQRAEASFETAVRLDPMMTEAYYQYGLACMRNGKPEKGKSLLEGYQRRRALRAPGGRGMSATSLPLPRMEAEVPP